MGIVGSSAQALVWNVADDGEFSWDLPPNDIVGWTNNCGARDCTTIQTCILSAEHFHWNHAELCWLFTGMFYLKRGSNNISPCTFYLKRGFNNISPCYNSNLPHLTTCHSETTHCCQASKMKFQQKIMRVKFLPAYHHHLLQEIDDILFQATT